MMNDDERRAIAAERIQIALRRMIDDEGFPAPLRVSGETAVEMADAALAVYRRCEPLEAERMAAAIVGAFGAKWPS